MEAKRHEQLFACAVWNSEESHRAFLAGKQQNDPAEKSYLQRRAVRLNEQAKRLFSQSEDEEREAFYASIHCDPSMHIYDGPAEETLNTHERSKESP